MLAIDNTRRLLYRFVLYESDGRVRDKGMNVNDQSGRRESKRKYGHNHVRTCRSGCLSHLKKPKPPNLQWFR